MNTAERLRITAAVWQAPIGDVAQAAKMHRDYVSKVLNGRVRPTQRTGEKLHHAILRAAKDRHEKAATA